MFAHGRLKLQTRDQLQNLTENTAYSVHGGISVRWYWFSTINPTYRRFHLAALAAQSLTLGGSHLIWTRVMVNMRAGVHPDQALRFRIANILSGGRWRDFRLLAINAPGGGRLGRWIGGLRGARQQDSSRDECA